MSSVQAHLEPGEKVAGLLLTRPLQQARALHAGALEQWDARTRTAVVTTDRHIYIFRVRDRLMGLKSELDPEGYERHRIGLIAVSLEKGSPFKILRSLLIGEWEFAVAWSNARAARTLVEAAEG